MNQETLNQFTVSSSSGLPSDNELFDSRTEQIIHAKAKSLVGFRLFQPYEQDDIEQDLRINLLHQMPKFNPELSNRYTYATMACDGKVKNMLKTRACSLAKGSCNASLEEEAGEYGETLGDRISGEDYRIAIGRQSMADDQLQALQEKVAVVLSQLPESDRAICRQIMEGYSLREIARSLKLPFSTFCDRFHNQICPVFISLWGGVE